MVAAGLLQQPPPIVVVVVGCGPPGGGGGPPDGGVGEVVGGGLGGLAVVRAVEGPVSAHQPINVMHFFHKQAPSHSLKSYNM